MMTAFHIALDVDDTFMDFIGPCQKALTEYTGKNIHRDLWHEYPPIGDYGITRDQLVHVMNHYNVLESAVPVVGAALLMNFIVQHKIRLTLATARAWHVRGEELTRASMTRWFPAVRYDLKVLDYGQSKADAFPADDVPHVMLDDSHKVCAEMLTHRPTCMMLMIKQPHNAHARHLHKSVNLSEALTILTHMHRKHHHEPQETTAN